MADVAEAVSGPQADNAGKVDALDAALEKAMGPVSDGSDDFPPVHLKDKLHGKKSETKVAGDARTSEDAGKPAKPSGEAPEAPAAEAVSAAIEAPNHWPAERKQAFAALSAHPDIQKAMLAMAKDLEGGFTRKSQELSDTAKFAESVRGLFNDTHRQQFANAGIDEVGAIRYLVSLQDFAARDPVRYLQWAMQSMGVTPEHLGFPARQPEQHHQRMQAGPQPASTGDPKLDALLADNPEVAQLRAQFGQFAQAALGEINALKQQSAQRHHQEQEYVRQQHVTALNQLRKQWGDFRSAQDENGHLRYPHADALQKQMGALMGTHPVLSSMPDGPDKLAKAYQMAMGADPELSKSLIEAEVARRFAEQQKKAEADKAKAAAKVKPATGAPTMPVKKGGLDAALDAAWASVGGGN